MSIGAFVDLAGRSRRRRMRGLELLVMEGSFPDWAIGKLVPVPYTGYHVRLTAALDSRVYFIESPSLSRVKIGVAKNPLHRLKIFNVGSPAGDLTVSATIKGNRSVEEGIHHAFRKYRIHREWFECGPELRDCIDVLRRTRAEVPRRLVEGHQLAGGAF